MELNNVDDFAAAVDTWYNNMLARLEHYLEVPTGSKLEFEDQSGESMEVVLEYDALSGFLAAIKMMHMELSGNPPFTSTENEEIH